MLSSELSLPVDHHGPSQHVPSLQSQVIPDLLVFYLGQPLSPNLKRCLPLGLVGCFHLEHVFSLFFLANY